MVSDSEQRVQELLETIKTLSESGVDDQVRELVMLNQKLQGQIVEREKAESELNKLSQAIEHAGDAILITDLKGDIEYINPAFTRITGYTPDEVVGKNPRILKSNAQDASVYKELWQTITAGETWRGSMIERRKNGTFYPANMSVAPIRNKFGEIVNYVAIQHDASERQELEERMRESQKMEALGVLVGGIAHDFNNMLTGMTGMPVYRTP